MIPNRILVIDDDPSWQELLAESIEAADAAPPGELTVRIARSFQEANALLDRQHFHLAFVDLRLKEDERELTGKRIAAKITGQDEGTCVVIVTGHADVSTAITALREWNVLDFVLKDEWDAEKVMHLVRTGLSASPAELPQQVRIEHRPAARAAGHLQLAGRHAQPVCPCQRSGPPGPPAGRFPE